MQYERLTHGCIITTSQANLDMFKIVCSMLLEINVLHLQTSGHYGSMQYVAAKACAQMCRISSVLKCVGSLRCSICKLSADLQTNDLLRVDANFDS